MKKILNVILGLAFIVIIVSGWVFGISAYRKVSKLEERQQEEMEKLKIQLVEDLDRVARLYWETEARIAELEETIITLEEYNDLVERIEELEEIANAFDDLEDALEKALNAINTRLDALEELE